jgi:hypothetical protein
MSRLALLRRLLVCLALLLIHYCLIFLPVSELFLIYILLANPRWFRDFLNRTAQERNNHAEP